MTPPPIQLREYIEGKIASERELTEHRWKSHEDRHEQISKALELAREEVQSKLDEMNEVRKQINQERGVYATREAVDAAVRRLDEQITAASKTTDATRTQLALLAALVAIIVPVALYFLRYL